MPSSPTARPDHLRPGLIGLVFLGGAAGTAVRAGLGLLAPTGTGIPWVTLAINLIGAFVLALLLEFLASAGPDRGWRKSVRLGVGTGVLGGFTTYSALAADTVVLLSSSRVGAAVFYAVGTLVLGVLASFFGLLTARSLHTPREETR